MKKDWQLARAAAAALRKAIFHWESSTAEPVPALHETLAAALERVGDLEGCIREAKKSMAAQTSANAYYQVGRCEDGLGRFASAQEAYRKAIHDSTEDDHRIRAGAWARLAALKRFVAGDPDEAAMRAALPSSGDHKKYLLFALGKAREDNRDYEGAFQYFEQGRTTAAAGSRLPN